MLKEDIGDGLEKEHKKERKEEEIMQERWDCVLIVYIKKKMKGLFIVWNAECVLKNIIEDLLKRKMKKRVIKRKLPKIKRIQRGYVQLKLGLKWIFEHRLVVENFIGRELTEEEVVHHIDSNRQNNSINNLMIFPNQKEHAKFHIYFTKYGFNQRVRIMIKERWQGYKIHHLQVNINV